MRSSIYYRSNVIYLHFGAFPQEDWACAKHPSKHIETTFVGALVAFSPVQLGRTSGVVNTAAWGFESVVSGDH